MSARNDDHDDGLVHGHAWASASTPGPRQHVMPVKRPVAPQDRDDGLVHSHGWASAERGRMARQ